MSHARQKRWNSLHNKLNATFEGNSFGVRLSYLKDTLCENAQDQALLESVLLHDFIEAGRVMVIYDSEKDYTMYYPSMEVYG